MRIMMSIVVIVALVLMIIDTVYTPSPAPKTCSLNKNIILPDLCSSGCDPALSCPPTKTRPYLFFFTQAASCPDFCINLP
jgi:hypothetical protein